MTTVKDFMLEMGVLKDIEYLSVELPVNLALVNMFS